MYITVGAPNTVICEEADCRNASAIAKQCDSHGCNDDRHSFRPVLYIKIRCRYADAEYGNEMVYAATGFCHFQCDRWKINEDSVLKNRQPEKPDDAGADRG